MGPEQLSGVMAHVEANSARNKGVVLEPEAAQKRVQQLRMEVQRDSSCYRTSGVVLDDGIIDPRDSRDVLAMCLEIVRVPQIEGSAGHRSLARM